MIIIILVMFLERCNAGGNGCSSFSRSAAQCLGIGFNSQLTQVGSKLSIKGNQNQDAEDAATEPGMMCFWCVTNLKDINKNGLCQTCNGLVSGATETEEERPQVGNTKTTKRKGIRKSESTRFHESKCKAIYTRSRFKPDEVRKFTNLLETRFRII